MYVLAASDEMLLLIARAEERLRGVAKMLGGDEELEQITKALFDMRMSVTRGSPIVVEITDD